MAGITHVVFWKETNQISRRKQFDLLLFDVLAHPGGACHKEALLIANTKHSSSRLNLFSLKKNYMQASYCHCSKIINKLLDSINRCMMLAYSILRKQLTLVHSL